MAHAAARATSRRGNGQDRLPAPPPHLATTGHSGSTPAARAIVMLQAVTPFRPRATLSAIEAAHRSDGSGGTRLMTIAKMLTGMDLSGSDSRELLTLERELRDAVNRQCDDDIPETSWYRDAMNWIEGQRAAVGGRRSH